MKLFTFSFIALLVTMAVTSCKKDKDVQIAVAPVEEPAPPSTGKSIAGSWAGHSVMMEKSIPVYFSFQIKAGGSLDVLNVAGKIIGTGNWALSGDNFRAMYFLFETASAFSVAGHLQDGVPARLSGSWGFDSNDYGGGFWDMDRLN